MKNQMNWILGLMVLAIVSRWIPHLPNFSPMGALALFAGVRFINRKWALTFPLVALLISDLVLGFYPGMIWNYAAFALVAIIGMLISKKESWGLIGAGALASSITFFIISNLGVWFAGGLYPMTAEGLMACFTAAVPFFHHTLMGDAVYTCALFGGFVLAQKAFSISKTA